MWSTQQISFGWISWQQVAQVWVNSFIDGINDIKIVDMNKQNPKNIVYYDPVKLVQQQE